MSSPFRRPDDEAEVQAYLTEAAAGRAGQDPRAQTLARSTDNPLAQAIGQREMADRERSNQAGIIDQQRAQEAAARDAARQQAQAAQDAARAQREARRAEQTAFRQRQAEIGLRENQIEQTRLSIEPTYNQIRSRHAEAQKALQQAGAMPVQKGAAWVDIDQSTGRERLLTPEEVERRKAARLSAQTQFDAAQKEFQPVESQWRQIEDQKREIQRQRLKLEEERLLKAAGLVKVDPADEETAPASPMAERLVRLQVEGSRLQQAAESGQIAPEVAAKRAAELTQAQTAADQRAREEAAQRLAQGLAGKPVEVVDPDQKARDIAAKFLGTGTNAQRIAGQSPGIYDSTKGAANQIGDVSDGISQALKQADGDIDSAIQWAKQQGQAIPLPANPLFPGAPAVGSTANTQDALKFSGAAEQLAAMKAEMDAAQVPAADRPRIIQDAAKAYAWSANDSDVIRELSSGAIAINPGRIFGQDKAMVQAAIAKSAASPEQKTAALERLELMRDSMARQIYADNVMVAREAIIFDGFEDFAKQQEAAGITDQADILDAWTAQQQDRNVLFKSANAIAEGARGAQIGIGKTALGTAAGIAAAIGDTGSAEFLGSATQQLGKRQQRQQTAAESAGITGGYAIASDLTNTIGQMAPMFATAGAGRALEGVSGAVTQAMGVYGWSAAQGYESKLSDALDEQRQKLGRDLRPDEVASALQDPKTQTAAFLNGVQTAALAKILGGGAERAALGKAAESMTLRQFLGRGGARAFRDGTLRAEAKAMAKTIFADASDEAVEESLNQALDLMISKVALGKDVKLGDAIEEIAVSGALGGLIGGSLPQLGNGRPNIPAAQRPDLISAAIATEIPTARAATANEIQEAQRLVKVAADGNDETAVRDMADAVLIVRELDDIEDNAAAELADAQAAVESAAAGGDPAVVQAAQDALAVAQANTPPVGLVRAALRIASGQQIGSLSDQELRGLGYKPEKDGSIVPMTPKELAEMGLSKPMVRPAADGSAVLVNEAIEIVRQTSPRAAARIKLTEEEALASAKQRAVSAEQSPAQAGAPTDSLPIGQGATLGGAAPTSQPPTNAPNGQDLQGQSGSQAPEAAPPPSTGPNAPGGTGGGGGYIQQPQGSAPQPAANPASPAPVSGLAPEKIASYAASDAAIYTAAREANPSLPSIPDIVAAATGTGQPVSPSMARAAEELAQAQPAQPQEQASASEASNPPPRQAALIAERIKARVEASLPGLQGRINVVESVGRSSGGAIAGSDGTVTLVLADIEAQLGTFDPQAVEDSIAGIVTDHEVTHVVQYEAVRRAWQDAGGDGTFGQFWNQWYGQIAGELSPEVIEIAADLYNGNTAKPWLEMTDAERKASQFGSLPNTSQAAEVVRMLVEASRPGADQGRFSELMRAVALKQSPTLIETLRRAVEILVEMITAGKLPESVRQHVDAISALYNELVAAAEPAIPDISQDYADSMRVINEAIIAAIDATPAVATNDDLRIALDDAASGLAQIMEGMSAEQRRGFVDAAIADWLESNAEAVQQAAEAAQMAEQEQGKPSSRDKAKAAREAYQARIRDKAREMLNSGDYSVLSAIFDKGTITPKPNAIALILKRKKDGKKLTEKELALLRPHSEGGHWDGMPRKQDYPGGGNNVLVRALIDAIMAPQGKGQMPHEMATAIQQKGIEKASEMWEAVYRELESISRGTALVSEDPEMQETPENIAKAEAERAAMPATMESVLDEARAEFGNDHPVTRKAELFTIYADRISPEMEDLLIPAIQAEAGRTRAGVISPAKWQEMTSGWSDQFKAIHKAIASHTPESLEAWLKKLPVIEEEAPMFSSGPQGDFDFNQSLHSTKEQPGLDFNPMAKRGTEIVESKADAVVTPEVLPANHPSRKIQTISSTVEEFRRMAQSGRLSLETYIAVSRNAARMIGDAIEEENLSPEAVISTINSMPLGGFGRAVTLDVFIKKNQPEGYIAFYDFENGNAMADATSVADYWSTKPSYGKLQDIVFVPESFRSEKNIQAMSEGHADAPFRVIWQMKKTNPYYVRMATRNEIKAIFGPQFVEAAMRNNKTEFLGQETWRRAYDSAVTELAKKYGSVEAAIQAGILRENKSKTGQYQQLVKPTVFQKKVEPHTSKAQEIGITLDQLWTAIRRGDAALANRLAAIDSPGRRDFVRRKLAMGPLDPSVKTSGTLFPMDITSHVATKEKRPRKTNPKVTATQEMLFGENADPDVEPPMQLFSSSAWDTDSYKIWRFPDEQTITSAETSINSKTPAAGFKAVKWKSGTVNADIGGGRFNNATEMLAGMGVENVIFDPFNRTWTENKQAVSKIHDGQANTATVFNVLNVIREPEVRELVIRQAANSLKSGGQAYFQVYEGDKSGTGKKTPKGWQENRPLDTYIAEISRHFGQVRRFGQVISAEKPIRNDDVLEQAPIVQKQLIQGQLFSSQPSFDFGAPLDAGTKDQRGLDFGIPAGPLAKFQENAQKAMDSATTDKAKENIAARVAEKEGIPDAKPYIKAAIGGQASFDFGVTADFGTKGGQMGFDFAGKPVEVQKPAVRERQSSLPNTGEKQTAPQETAKPANPPQIKDGTAAEVLAQLDAAGKTTSEADKLRKKAEALTKQAMKVLEGIEPGQPIRTTADRNRRERAAEIQRKASDLIKQAEGIEKNSMPEIEKSPSSATPAEKTEPATTNNDAQVQTEGIEQTQAEGQGMLLKPQPSGEKSPAAATVEEVAAENPSYVAPIPETDTLTPEQAASELAKRGITIEKDSTKTGKTVWRIMGKTFDVKDHLKAMGAKWFAPAKAWSIFSNEDPTQAIADTLAGKQPAARPASEPSTTPAGDDAGTDGKPGEDLRLRQLRNRLDRSADERRDRNDALEAVDTSTADLIRRGLKYGMPQEVVEDQIEDIAMITRAFEAKKPMFLLGNGAGTGKTFVLGGAIRELRAAGASNFVYVTMNTDLIAQIKRDLADFGIQDVSFHTYSEMSGKSGVPLPDNAVLIFDEAHNVKNSDSSRGEKAQPMMARAKFTIFASATPFENPVEAAYLAGTGVFNEAGGHTEWGKAYGANVRKFKVMTPYGMQERETLYWTGGKLEDGLAARQWFVRQGIMVTRPMRLPMEMVESQFTKRPVTPEYVEIHDRINAAYEEAMRGFRDEDGNILDARNNAMVSMHQTNTIKRVLEAAKVDQAVEEANRILDAGGNVVIFVETKADRFIGRYRASQFFDKSDRLYTYPEIREEMAHWQVMAGMARMSDEPKPPRPFAEFIVQIARAMHEAGIEYELPSVEDQIVEKLGGTSKVAIYTGSVSNSAASKDKEAFLAGKKRVIVATMAKGGTGLSLHDKIGNRETWQVNLNLPWRATGVDQVSGRVARYGLQSKAHINWLFAENIPFERMLAGRVGRRMRDMGALVKGIDMKAARVLTDEFDFQGTTDVKQREGEVSAPDVQDDIWALAERLEKSRSKASDTSMGFFETPYPLAALMTEVSGARGSLLEPSGGRGNLVRFVKDNPKVTSIQIIEARRDNADYLKGQYGDWVTQGDFLEEADSLGKFDTIHMNPPFERVAGIGAQDVAHVMRAFDLLEDNGRLVAIMGEGAFFRNYQQEREFRQWLDDRGAVVVKLPENAFKNSGTGVRTRMVIIDKAGVAGRTDIDLEDMDTDFLQSVADAIPNRDSVQMFSSAPVGGQGFFDFGSESGFNTKSQLGFNFEGQPIAKPEPNTPDFRLLPTEDKKAIVQEKTRATAERKAAGIQDFGEKIGGARKDLASKSEGTKTKRKTGDKPGWFNRYEVAEVVAEIAPNSALERYWMQSASAGYQKKQDEVGRFVINDKRKVDWHGNPERAINRSFATREEAEAAIPLVEVSRNHKIRRETVDGKDQWGIWRIVSDRKRVQVVKQAFDTEDEAREFMAKNATDIIETKTAWREELIVKPEVAVRKGPERRNRPATPEMFQEAFGFRGVEFGNWMRQAGDGKERQEVLNHAYDGLIDMAEILGVPTKALSLNGELGLAFGARGQGLSGAKAHYESDFVVINLTKMSGAGSLAHEWIHAFDHYLGRQDGRASSKWVNKGGNMMLEGGDPSSRMVSHRFSKDSGVREEVRNAFIRLMDTIMTKAVQYVSDTEAAERFVQATRERLAKSLAGLRKDYTRDPDPRWEKRRKPATVEQLAAFDEIANRLISGEDLVTEWRQVEGKAKWGNFRWTNDALERLNVLHKAITNRAGFNKDGGALDYLASDIKAYRVRLTMLKDAQSTETKFQKVPTEFSMNAKRIDQGSLSDYWNTPHEMLARAFSAYIEDRIGESGGASDFLSYGSDNALPLYRMLNVKPFPEGSERDAINQEFDNLFSTIETRETEKGVQLYSSTLSTEQDSAYLAAVEAGDMETAQRMVDEAARAAGFTSKVFHGTKQGPFYVFQKTVGRNAWFGEGVYVSRSETGAKHYAGATGKVIMGWARISNPLQITTDQQMDSVSAAKFTANAKANGYDSIEVTGRDETANEVVLFNPNQIKSADPVTYDADGNVIPLSQRFDPRSDSILYSSAPQQPDLFAAATAPDAQEKLGDVKVGRMNALAAYRTLTAKRNAGKTLDSKEEQQLLDAEQALGQKLAFDMEGVKSDAPAVVKESLTTPPPVFGQNRRDIQDEMMRTGEVDRSGQISLLSSAVSDSAFEREKAQILKSAKRGNDGHPLSPNGERSNLTEDQWATVRTKNFKKWFGDWEKFAAMEGGVWNDTDETVSKVVDENGEPLVVYHGSKEAGFDTFDPSMSDSRLRPDSVFFSDSRKTARTYSGSWDDVNFFKDEDGEPIPHRAIYAVFLNIRNPLEAHFEGANWDGRRDGQYMVQNADGEQVYSENGRGYFSDEDEAQSVADANDGSEVLPADDSFESTNSVAMEAKRYGNDGAIIRDVMDDGGEAETYETSNVFVAFDSNQAKSAVANNGGFSSDPSILFSSAVHWPTNLYAYDYRTESNRGEFKHIVRTYNERTGRKEDRKFDTYAEAKVEMDRLDDLGSPAMFSSPAGNPDSDPVQAAFLKMPPLFADVFRAVEAGATPEQVMERFPAVKSPRAVTNILNQVRARVMVAQKAAAGTLEPETNEEGKFINGRPDLAESGSRDFTAVDQIRNDSDIPDSVSMAENYAAANKRLAADYEGEFARLERMAQTGQRPDAVDIAIAKEIFRRETLSAGLDDPQRRMRLALFRVSYREQGTEQARAFQMRRDEALSPAERNALHLTELLYEPSPEVQERMNGADKQTRDAILKQWMKRIDAFKAEMKAEGIDIEASLAAWHAHKQAVEKAETVHSGSKAAMEEAMMKLSGREKTVIRLIRDGAKLSTVMRQTGMTKDQVMDVKRRFGTAWREAIIEAGRRFAANSLASSSPDDIYARVMEDLGWQSDEDFDDTASDYLEKQSEKRKEAKKRERTKKKIPTAPKIAALTSEQQAELDASWERFQSAPMATWNTLFQTESKRLGPMIGQKAFEEWKGQTLQPWRDLWQTEMTAITDPDGRMSFEQWLERPQSTWTATRTNLFDAFREPINEIRGTFDVNDPFVMAELINEWARRNGTWINKITEFYKMAILSGPQTMLINATGGLFVGYELIVKRSAEAAWNGLMGMFGAGDVRSATFSEFLPMLKQVRAAMSLAARNAMESWKLQSPVFESYASGKPIQLDFTGVGSEYVPPATTSAISRFLRNITFRELTAVDEFWKGMFAQLDVAALAHRIAAKEEKLSGKDYSDRVKGLMEPGSLAWQRTLSRTRRATFQDPMAYGKWTKEDEKKNPAHKEGMPMTWQQALKKAETESAWTLLDAIAVKAQEARKTPFFGPLLHMFVLPFIATPKNLMQRGLEVTPLGLVVDLIDGMRSLRRRVMQGDITKEESNRIAAELYNNARFIQTLTNQSIGVMLYLAIESLTGGDDKDKDGRPHITGTLPFTGTKKGERDNAQAVMPPQSIRIGETIIPYGRIDPFATALSFMVDLAESRNRNDGYNAQVVTDSVVGLKEQFKDKLFLKGIGDILRVIENPERGADRLAAGWITGFVPNIVRQPVREMDKTMRDTNPKADDGFFTAVAKRIGFGIIPQTAPAKLDVWGDPIPTNRGDLLADSNMADSVFRVFDPLNVRLGGKIRPIDAWIFHYNHRQPDSSLRIGIEAPDDEVTIQVPGESKPRKVALTPEEHAESIRRIGQSALNMLGDQWDWRTAANGDAHQKAELIKDTFTKLKRQETQRLKIQKLSELRPE